MKYLLLTTIIGLSACVQHEQNNHISCPRLVNGEFIEGECNNGIVHSGILDRGDRPVDPPSDNGGDSDEEVTDPLPDSDDSNGDNSDGDSSDDSNGGKSKGKGEGRKDHKKR